MTITITVRVDDHADAYRLAADLTNRFGPERVDTWHDDELEPDDTATDIGLIAHVRHIIEEAASEDELRTNLRSLQEDLSDSNQHMRWIDQLLALHDERDQAPAHGLARPQVIDLPRPNATRLRTNNAAHRNEALTLTRDAVACPTCHARIGQWCHGPNWGSDATHTYGTQHMHEARISLLRWES